MQLSEFFTWKEVGLGDKPNHFLSSCLNHLNIPVGSICKTKFLPIYIEGKSVQGQSILVANIDLFSQGVVVLNQFLLLLEEVVERSEL